MRPAKHRDAEIASDDQKHVARKPGHRRNITGLCHADEDRATYRGTMKLNLGLNEDCRTKEEQELYGDN